MTLLIAWLSVALLGCGGSTCHDACEQLNGGECNVQSPGYPTIEQMDQRLDTCRSAMRRGGKLDGYDPMGVPREECQDTPLDNRAQATEWADCVVETACEPLWDGQCCPRW